MQQIRSTLVLARNLGLNLVQNPLPPLLKTTFITRCYFYHVTSLPTLHRPTITITTISILISPAPPSPLPIRSTCAGSRNLGQSVASSRDSCSYKNLSTVKMGLQVVCLCQRFDRQSPTLNTPQLDCLCSGLFSSLSTVQQPAHHFWLALFAPSLPLSQIRY